MRGFRPDGILLNQVEKAAGNLLYCHACICVGDCLDCGQHPEQAGQSRNWPIAGAKDRHTKLAESQALFNAAREPKEFWVLDEAAHEDALSVAKEEYERRVLLFFQQHLSR